MHYYHYSFCTTYWIQKIWQTIVSFIPYFRLLVFGILITLVAWFSFRFFPSCLAKCKQRLCNIFVTLSPKVTKNQKWKMRWTKHLVHTRTNYIWTNVQLLIYCATGRYRRLRTLVRNMKPTAAATSLSDFYIESWDGLGQIGLIILAEQDWCIEWPGNLCTIERLKLKKLG